MPLPPVVQAAIDRLRNFYEGDQPYDPASNPGGFRRGGNIPNYVPSLKDVGLAAQTVGDLADRTRSDADTTAANRQAVDTRAAQVEDARQLVAAAQPRVAQDAGAAAASRDASQAAAREARQYAAIAGATVLDFNLDPDADAGAPSGDFDFNSDPDPSNSGNA